MGLWINLGAGEVWSHARKPWINIDARASVLPRVVADIRNLPFGAMSASRVYAGHVLEHLEREEVLPALLEILRVLEPGGEFLAVGPDVVRARQMFAEGAIDAERLRADGCHGDPGDVCVHHWNCEGEIVAALMAEAGFEGVVAGAVTLAPNDWPVYDRRAQDQFSAWGRKP
jgi:SAM-dependent methyltransferase